MARNIIDRCGGSAKIGASLPQRPRCPLLGVKRTSLIGWPMSANDPKRTSTDVAMWLLPHEITSVQQVADQVRSRLIAARWNNLDE
jgi:hypothetical protein